MVEDADTPLVRELKRLMSARNMRAKGLSLTAGLSETYVRDLLKGKSRSPEASKLAKIEDALGVEPGVLVRATSLPQEAEIVTDPAELLLLETWRELGQERQKTALEYLRFLTSRAPGVNGEAV